MLSLVEYDDSSDEEGLESNKKNSDENNNNIHKKDKENESSSQKEFQNTKLFDFELENRTDTFSNISKLSKKQKLNLPPPMNSSGTSDQGNSAGESKRKITISAPINSLKNQNLEEEEEEEEQTRKRYKPGSSLSSILPPPKNTDPAKSNNPKESLNSQTSANRTATTTSQKKNVEKVASSQIRATLSKNFQSTTTTQEKKNPIEESDIYISPPESDHDHSTTSFPGYQESDQFSENTHNYYQQGNYIQPPYDQNYSNAHQNNSINLQPPEFPTFFQNESRRAKKGTLPENIEFIDVNQSEIRPLPAGQAIVANSSHDVWRPPPDSSKPNKVQRQRHQITYLAFEHAQKEHELVEKRAASLRSKSQVRARYGW